MVPSCQPQAWVPVWPLWHLSWGPPPKPTARERRGHLPHPKKSLCCWKAKGVRFILMNCRLSENSPWSLISLQSSWGGPRVNLRE